MLTALRIGLSFPSHHLRRIPIPRIHIIGRQDAISCLPKLANNTVYHVLNNIPTDNILYFALCCKMVSVLAQDTLELHGERRARYTDIVVRDRYRRDPDAHPLRLIRDACQDRRVGLYAKRMTIQCYDSSTDDDGSSKIKGEKARIWAAWKGKHNITVWSILSDHANSIFALDKGNEPWYRTTSI